MKSLMLSIFVVVFTFAFTPTPVLEANYTKSELDKATKCPKCETYHLVGMPCPKCG